MTPDSWDSAPLIRGFLRRARKSAGPAPGAAGPARGRRRGLSQEAAALRTGVSTRLYQDWEGGVRAIPAARLDRLAEALGLDPGGRDELWSIATGGFPPAGPGRPDPAAAGGWTRYLRALPVPALTVDAAWDVQESNSAWRELFEPAGQTPPDNLLRFVLFSPYARALCGEWERDWAVPYLGRLRLEAETSRHAGLLRTVAALQDRPDLAALWRAAGETGRTAVHDDGRVRLLLPPPLGRPHRVQTLVSTPAHDPGRRIHTFLPVPAPAA